VATQAALARVTGRTLPGGADEDVGATDRGSWGCDEVGSVVKNLPPLVCPFGSVEALTCGGPPGALVQ
jgi:hypothetical protein